MSRDVRFRLGDLGFVWDDAKARTNADKHGITFAEAATTWLDPLALERADDAHADREARWIRIGESLRGALIVAWSTERETRSETVIRIIGARRANRKERRLYEQSQEDDL